VPLDPEPYRRVSVAYGSPVASKLDETVAG